MRLADHSATILPLASSHGIETLANWTKPFDFAAFVIGRESPRAVRDFLAAFSAATGLPACAGRLDDLTWDNAINLELEWFLLGPCRVVAPPKASLNGVAMATLPHVREARYAPGTRRFRFKYMQAPPVLGESVLLKGP